MKQARLNNDNKKDEFVNKMKEMQKTIFDLEAKNEDLEVKLQIANENAKVKFFFLNCNYFFYAANLYKLKYFLLFLVINSFFVVFFGTTKIVFS
jgi:hypothetical protein